MKFLFLNSIIFLLVSSCNSLDKKENTDTDSLSTSLQNIDSIAEGSISNPLKPGSSILPIKFKGQLDNSLQWKDILGENILITSFLTPYTTKMEGSNEEGRTAELYAFHYIKKERDWKLVWQLNDGVKDCPLDIAASFFKDAVTITDLDNDGIAETTIQYKLACRGDVSPSIMKLIMHEDSVKYSLRGLMWVSTGQEDKFSVTEKDMNLESLPEKKDEFEKMMQQYGRYESEKEFAKAPASFLQYAKSRWLQFVKESFE